MTHPAPDGAQRNPGANDGDAKSIDAAAAFKADLAHEIRTPLQILRTSIDFLQRAGRNDPAVFERMRTAAAQIAALLDLGQGETAESEPTISSVAEDVKIAVDWVASIASYPAIEWTGQCVSHAAIRPSDLRRVIVNLLENAGAAIREKRTGSKILVTCKDEVDRDGRAFITITVVDDGPGIPREIADRLFEKGVTTRRDHGGSGRGLSFCRDIVAAANGRISCDRTLPKGAAFRIELPATADAPSSESSSKKGSPVLLVDDDLNLLTTYRMILELEGYDVVVETNGKDAVEKISSGAFAAALVDLHLKDLTGQEILDEVTRRDPTLARRIIFATGDAAAQRSRKFLERCGNLYLLKPFSIDDLKRAFAALGIFGSSS